MVNLMTGHDLATTIEKVVARHMLAFAAFCAIMATSVSADDTVLPIVNGGFEGGLEGWKIYEQIPMCSVSDEQAASGTRSLKVVDAHSVHGSGASCARVPIIGPGGFELRGKVFPVSGDGLGMYVRVLDKDGKPMHPGDRFLRSLGGSDRKWKPFNLTVFTSEDAAYLELWIHSYSHANVVAYLDDLHFVDLDETSMKPPWEGTYKIRPSETGRLTAADVVGPDGLVYPNWTRCGVQGDIPNVEVAARIEDFGGKADDDADDHEALDQACLATGERGGGAVLLGEGTYYLGRPVTIRHDGVVIRGRGADKTKLIFRYALPGNGAQFYHPPSGSRVGKNTPIILHSTPKDLLKMSILIDGTQVHRWTRSQHSGNTYAMSANGRLLLDKAADGAHELTGVAEYKDGSTRRTRIPVMLDSHFEDDRLVASTRGAITFEGAGFDGRRRKLAEDGKRGATRLVVSDVEDLEVGDRILIDGPPTPRWKDLTRNQCQWGMYRRYEVMIEKIEGNTLTVNQPLRIEFPVVDGAYVQKMATIQGCGIEDVYIEQTEDLWISTVVFEHAWNCWARGVRVRKCGRNPIYGHMAKWCTIRDCVFDDAWFKGGGGTAYAGWEHSWDCLMENCETFKFRHAPLVQWSASGNVIRNSVFHDSDAQWHSGWTNENLFENCTVTSRRGHGSYGYGAWASPPEDTAHGPNGPRNVVYNCDIRSEKTGLWMGGMNENWLILHNRFVADNGYGVFAKTCSFDHIIQGNVFVLKDKVSSMLHLGTPDCVGVELTGNTLYGGNGVVCDSWGRPAVEKDNRVFGPDEAPRPQPAVPSIYEWQLENIAR